MRTAFEGALARTCAQRVGERLLRAQRAFERYHHYPETTHLFCEEDREGHFISGPSEHEHKLLVLGVKRPSSDSQVSVDLVDLESVGSTRVEDCYISSSPPVPSRTTLSLRLSS